MAGGNITRIVGGTNSIETDEWIVYTDEFSAYARKGSYFTADGGTTIGEPKDPPLPKLNEKINCALHFRPLKKWKGEYGFDFYRNGHKEIDNDINYSLMLGKYYKDSGLSILNDNINDWTDFFSSTPNVLKDSNEFSKYTYVLDGSSKIYYIPYLALFSPNVANSINEITLNCFIEGDLPEKIEFVVPTNMNITLSATTISKVERKFEIKVHCTAAFSDDTQPISVFGLKKIDNKEVKEEIGKLNIVAPSKILKKQIVVVRVKTGFLSKGKVSNSILNKFIKLTKQALIDVEVTTERENVEKKMVDIELDVRKPENNFMQTDFNKTFKTKGNLNKREGLNDFLINQLNLTYDNQYKDYFKLFLISENFIKGYIEDKETGEKLSKVLKAYTQVNVNWAIFFQGIEEETLTHELFHAFGLYHSFGNDSTYTFKALETENIMDYSNWEFDKNGVKRTPKERYYTWHWQWGLINSNL